MAADAIKIIFKNTILITETLWLPMPVCTEQENIIRSNPENRVGVTMIINIAIHVSHRRKIFHKPNQVKL